MFDMNSSIKKNMIRYFQILDENEYVLSKTRPQNFTFLLLAVARSSFKKAAKPWIYY